ncbi:SDR family NAD(P)-dependent oxidoreductase, partial [Streptomyces sp. NPDC023723]|uniref:SDR family NAD(P)-dependent oxidoreductase n=1 Tax=Streptomyces sp. NPDC023723 TaxID=3154323 RepID=UPI0033F36364
GHGARLAVVADDATDLAGRLDALAGRIEAGEPFSAPRAHFATGDADPGRIGFLFPGQGAQYVGMGAELAVHHAPARDAWDAVAAVLPVHREVFPAPVFDEADRAAQEAALTATEVAQPALAAHGLALLAVLARLNLTPDCVAGHSFGELTALHAAGCFDAATLVRLARRRGELMRDAATVPGGMVAVNAPLERVEPVVAEVDGVWVANHNAPRQVVLAGTDDALRAVTDRFAGDGVLTRRLNAAAAFHSPPVAAATAPLTRFLADVTVRPPALPVYAGADAAPYPADPAAVRGRVAAQLTAPVRFRDVVEAMYAAGVRTFVEVGPGTTLTGLTGAVLGDRTHDAISLDRPGQHALAAFYDGLGRAAVRGVPMDLTALWEGHGPVPESGAEHADAHAQERKPRMTIMINGGNVREVGGTSAEAAPSGPAVAPAPSAPSQPVVPPAPVAPPASEVSPGPEVSPASVVHAVAAPSSDWLSLLAEAQRQSAEAHATYQRVTAENHQLYLRTAHASMEALLGAAGVRAATGGGAGPLPGPVTEPVAVGGPSAHVVTGPPPPRAPLEAESAGTAPAVMAPPPTVDATPVPAPSAPLALSAPALDAESIGALLLQVVAERTGYPADIINPDMELETDLGIDSIKKVEILSRIRERVGELPAADLSELASLRTLREISDKVAEMADRAGGTTEPVRSGVESAVAAAPESSAPVRRAVRAVPSAPAGLALAGLRDREVLVVGDSTQVATLLVQELAAYDVPARVVTEVPSDARSVVLLDQGDDPLAAFAVARELAGRLRADGGVLVTVQDTGGDFGLSGGGDHPVRGAPAALARTAALEWPSAAVKAIDCARAGRGDQEVASAIAAELVGGGPAVTVGLPADGSRTVPLPGPVEPGPPLPRVTAESVVVVTGGGRGVTAEAVRALAAAHRPRLVLLGRTALTEEHPGLAGAVDEAELVRALAASGTHADGPAELAAEARRVLAVREIRQTLHALRQSGSTARYVSVDIQDEPALRAALAQVRREWGPVTAVVHGAGVIADRLIGAKTDEQFSRVWSTKVAGLRALLAATEDDPLEVLVAFSSVSGVFGSPGQADYAMANTAVDHLLSAYAAAHPGCLTRSVAWGPWDGGMVTRTLAERFRAAGVGLIEPAAGARAFVAELADPAGPARVLLTAGGPAFDNGPAGPGPAAEVTPARPAYALLDDHRIDGTAVVPVAVLVHWFTALVRSWRPDAGPVVLHDLRVRRRIELPEQEPRLLLHGRPSPAEPARPGGLAVELSAAGTSYAGAVAVAGRCPAPGHWAAADPLGLEPVPEPYDGRVLFHGPAFQVLDQVRLCADGGRAALRVRDTGPWEAVPWAVDVAALDGALQLAVGWAARSATGAALPVSVRECRIHRAGQDWGAAQVVVTARRADRVSAECDAAVLAEDGTPLAELLGVELIHRPDLTEG